MQKKIIALAVAGLASTAVFAQSNVTVYGIADVYGVAANSNGTHIAGVNSGGLSGSRLGFKGTEDLGGGNKALFTLEYGLSMDDNTGVGATTALARQQFVGLSGGMGTVVGGRLQTLVYNHNAAYNPTFGSVVDTLANVAGRANTGFSSNLGTAERLNNAVAYVAPAMGGVTLAAAHTFGTTTDTATASSNVRATEASAKYDGGPLSLGLVYQDVKLANGMTADQASRGTALGVSYDLGPAKLMLDGNRQESASNPDTVKVTTYNAAVVVPVSAKGSVVLSQAKAQNKSDNDWTSKALVYKHSLSARTTVYGGVASAASAGATASLAGATSDTNGDVAAALVGVNHSF